MLSKRLPVPSERAISAPECPNRPAICSLPNAYSTEQTITVPISARFWLSVSALTHSPIAT